MLIISVIFGTLLLRETLSWRSGPPKVPSEKRSQFLILLKNGGYEYGYNTGDGHSAEQKANEVNNVHGQYSYQNAAETNVNLKYSTGGQSALNLANNEGDDGSYFPGKYGNEGQYTKDASEANGHLAESVINSAPNVEQSDGSYSFSFLTSDQDRAEASDAQRKISGRFSYVNKAGKHDLAYIAGAETGFLPTGGSLATPNGLAGLSVTAPETSLAKEAGFLPSNIEMTKSLNPNDASYSYSFSTGEQSKQESSDAQGKIQGRYSYTNKLGSHDLAYVAGSGIGFQPVGGSLVPHELPSLAASNEDDGSYRPDRPNDGLHKVAESSYVQNGDSSYKFAFASNDQNREESSDSNGNINGKFSYTNKAGKHDLAYTAGSATGFLPTGGSLATPNGLGSINGGDASISSETIDERTGKLAGTSGLSTGLELAKTELSEGQDGIEVNNSGDDGAYRPEKYGGSDGQYKEDNSGQYNEADADKQIDASLKTSKTQNENAPYSFTISNADYNREESSDELGNVRGKFAYTNKAGKHDLSYVAGADTGFLPIGGSLATPNGLPIIGISQGTNEDIISSKSGNDGSYSFGFSTHDQSRAEASDTEGKVRGSYSYKNKEGNHNLAYVAGAEIGFQPVEGSLAKPAGGLSNIQGDSKSKQSDGSGGDEDDGSYHPDKYGGDEGTYVENNTENNKREETTNSFYPDTRGTPEKTQAGASYSFAISSDDQNREEASDASGNVHGKYSYTNKAGKHNLEYVAGSGTGFLPTGGSLAMPNGLASLEGAGVGAMGRIVTPPEAPAPPIIIPSAGFSIVSPPAPNPFGIIPYSPPSISEQVQQVGLPSRSSLESIGDASYKFSIDTDDYKRQESADAQGNIKVNFWYKNAVGNHDLSYIAGSGTGYKPVSGSLTLVPGLNEEQLVAGSKLRSNEIKLAKHTAALGTLTNEKITSGGSGPFKVITYLSPGVGYVYDTGC